MSLYNQNRRLLCAINLLIKNVNKCVTVQQLDNVNSRRYTTVRLKNKIYQTDHPLIEIPDVTFPEYMEKYFKKWSNRIAIESFETGKQYTYDEIPVRARALAANIRNKLGFQDGNTICVVMPNLPEYLTVALGVISANCVCSTCNPIYTVEEIKKQILNSTSKCVITCSEYYEKVKKAVDSLENPIPVILINTNNSNQFIKETISFEEFTNPNTDTSVLNKLKRPARNDTIFRPYSSGTTGLPKGVDLTHRNIVANLEQQYRLDTHYIPELGRDYPITVPAILPLYHIFGLSVVMLGKITVGQKILTISSFTTNKFIEVFKKHKPHSLHLVPPLILLMITNENLTKEDFSNVGIVLNGAAPLSESDTERLRKKLSPTTIVVQGYGLTETSPVVACYNRGLKHYNSGSIGTLVANTEARLINVDTNEDVKDGESGELWVRGPQVMKGYFNNEKATKESITEDGWFKTGDLVRVDEHGLFYVTDRLKELIKVKGFQVAPAELEALLRTHPDITDAAVIGVPHPFLGEAPKAFVVTRKNKVLSEKDVQEFVATQVSEFKRLAGGVKFVDEIPKSGAGKILRRNLK